MRWLIGAIKDIRASDENVWPVLAGMRLFLASVVCIGHIGIITTPGDAFYWWRGLSGHGAVLGFFVISGYSIAASIASRPQEFLRRRAIRILPVYWVGLLISTIPILQHGQTFVSSSGVVMTAPGVAQWIGNALLLQGFVTTFFYTFGQAWSISFEFFYYVLARWLNRLSLLSLSGTILISGLAYLFVLRRQPSIQGAMFGISAIGLAWAWLIGFALRKFTGRWWALAGLLAFGVFLLGQYDLRGGLHDSWQLFLGASLLTVVGGLIPLSKALIPVLRLAGEISYPLYIVHFGTMCVLNGAGVRDPYILVGSAFAVSFAVHFAVEMPIRGYWRRRSQDLVSRS